MTKQQITKLTNTYITTSNEIAKVKKKFQKLRETQKALQQQQDKTKAKLLELAIGKYETPNNNITIYNITSRPLDVSLYEELKEKHKAQFDKANLITDKYNDDMKPYNELDIELKDKAKAPKEIKAIKIK